MLSLHRLFSTSRRAPAKPALLAATLVAAAIAAPHAGAAILYSDNFNSMSNGNLVGQDGWNQTGTVATSPIQVASGVVLVGITGQDVNTALGGGTVVAGQSAYAALAMTVTSAAATGDYFFHFASGPFDSSLFTGRMYVKSTTGGYLLGFAFGSTGVTYGTTVLPLNTAEEVVLRYDINAGPTNDAATIYVNPTDLTTESNDTASIYATFTDTTVSEPTQTFGSVNLRQGGGVTSAPAVSLDSLTVATTFAESLSNPAPFFDIIPEPASLSLLGFGAVALLAKRRRRA